MSKDVNKFVDEMVKRLELPPSSAGHLGWYRMGLGDAFEELTKRAGVSASAAGKLGGKARAASLKPAQRTAIAKKAAKARWIGRKPKA